VVCRRSLHLDQEGRKKNGTSTTHTLIKEAVVVVAYQKLHFQKKTIRQVAEFLLVGVDLHEKQATPLDLKVSDPRRIRVLFIDPLHQGTLL
tara:strand:+ start:499 stop:771 length:273 start_codon:yes stop_codon:yes gene_type:complete